MSAPETLDDVAARTSLASRRSELAKGRRRARLRAIARASANVRFAKNEMTTSGEYDEATVSVLDRARQAPGVDVDEPDRPREPEVARVERALAMARLAPEDPETMPLLPPQTYAAAPPAHDAEARRDGAGRSRGHRHARHRAWAIAAKVQIAGFFYRDAYERVVRSSHRARRRASRERGPVHGDGAHAGRDRLRLGRPRDPSRERPRRRAPLAHRDRQGAALGEPARAAAGQVHGRPRAAGRRRDDRVPRRLDGPAQRRRGALLLHGQGRREAVPRLREPPERPDRPGDSLRAVRRRRNAPAPAAMDRRGPREGAARLSLLGDRRRT